MGKVITNQVYYAWMTSCDLPERHYEFGADGKMLDGIVEKDGVLYYYENGRGVEKGLVYCDGAYYFSQFMGELVVGTEFYAWMSSCDLPEGKYEFGADGKMLQGIVEKNGGLYYYENGKGVEKGLLEYNGGYYFSEYAGKLRTSESFYAWVSSCDLPAGVYEFGADGKMLDGIVEKNGKYYYYELGNAVEAGLVYIDGYYYFAQYGGELVVSQDFYVYNANGLLVETVYTFDEYGRIVK
jgi:glucan-binding YG repeat protein